MEIRGTDLLDDLVCNDDEKCLAALLKVTSKANGSGDLVPFFGGIMSNFLPPRNRTCRLLAYSLLQNFTECTPEEWDRIIPVVFEDVRGHDTDLQVEALRLIPHLPAGALLENMESGDLDLEQFRSEELNPVVAKAVIECFDTLLLHRPIAYSGENLAEFGWALICERTRDGDALVAHQAFVTISALFKEAARPIPSSRLTPASYDREFVNLLQVSYKLVLKTLLPVYEELWVKFCALDQSLRSACVGTLIHLTCHVMGGSTVISIEECLTSEYRVRVHQLVDELRALLQCNNLDLVFEAGKGLLYLAEKLVHPTWIHPVLAAYAGIMEQEMTSFALEELIKPIISVLPLLSASQQIFFATSAVLGKAHLLMGMEVRMYVLYRTFSFLLRTAMESDENVANYQEFLKRPPLAGLWVADQPHAFGEEAFAVVTECCRALYEQEQKTNKSPAALRIIQATMERVLPCFSWSTLDSSSLHRFLQLLDTLLTAHKDQFTSIFTRFSTPKNLEALPPTTASALIFFLACKHTPQHAFLAKALEHLRTNFFQYREKNEQGVLDASVSTAQQKGYLGSDTDNCPVPPVECLEVLLSTLAFIFLSGNDADRNGVVKLLAYIVERVTNPLMVSRCKLMLKRMEGHKKNKISRQFFPWMFSAPAPRTPDYHFWIRMVAAGFSHLSENIEKLSLHDLSWTQIAGPSSPVDIQVAHLLDRSLSRLILCVKIRNHTDITIRNFRVLLCHRGGLECVSEPQQQQISKFVTYLDFHQTLEWQLAFHVPSFKDVNFSIRTMFLSPATEEDALTANVQRTSWINTAEFSNQSYSVAPGAFLLPVPFTRSEFDVDWNHFSVGFHVGAKTMRQASLPELLQLLRTFPGFYASEARAWGEEQYFQVFLGAVSWFHDQICVAITGELDPIERKWMARFEFRASSKKCLVVFRAHVAEWLRVHTKNLMIVLDDDAIDDTFNVTH